MNTEAHGYDQLRLKNIFHCLMKQVCLMLLQHGLTSRWLLDT